VAADALIEEHLDLVDNVVRYVIKKYRIDNRLWDDVRSAAGLALVQAGRMYDPERAGAGYTARSFLFQKMVYLVIDDLRRLHGRTAETRAARRTLTLTPLSGEFDEEYEWLSDPTAEDAFDSAERLEFIHESLEALADDREREIALRLANGDRMREIGERFGVSESRISQLVARMRDREPDEDEPESEPEPEPERRSEWGKQLSLDVSWR